MKFQMNFKGMFLLIAILLLASLTLAGNITKPYTFAPDTPASSAQVNANFDALYNKVNELSAKNDELSAKVTALETGNAGKLPPADYDSGCFEMKSQAGVNSYKEISHNLGVYPKRVKVLVKAIDGANQGFIFEGTGSAQKDDDTVDTNPKEYGGIVFAYNENRVRLWAPDKNNDSASGSIICVTDGWGGEVNAQQSHTASVKVLVWK